MGKKILIVDDSSTMREMVKLTLEDADYEVFEAEDGVEGIAQVKSQDLDMIITDLNMPNKDGMTFIREARELENCKFTPIVMLTTESEMSKKEEGREAGANGWIVKPFVPEKLIMVISKVLGWVAL